MRRSIGQVYRIVSKDDPGRQVTVVSPAFKSSNGTYIYATNSNNNNARLSHA